MLPGVGGAVCQAGSPSSSSWLDPSVCVRLASSGCTSIVDPPHTTTGQPACWPSRRWRSPLSAPLTGPAVRYLAVRRCFRCCSVGGWHAVHDVPGHHATEAPYCAVSYHKHAEQQVPFHADFRTSAQPVQDPRMALQADNVPTTCMNGCRSWGAPHRQGSPRSSRCIPPRGEYECSLTITLCVRTALALP